MPFGYRPIYQSHAGHWEIETEEAALVQRIYAMCLSGMLTRAIARQLTEERIPTKCDRHPEEGGNKRQARGVWSPQSVHQILTYQGYTGVAYWGKRTCVSKTARRRESRANWIQIPIPAIIDEATFQAAQRQLERNKASAVRNRRHEYLVVGGRFRCGRCGRAMTGLPGTGVLYYRCGASYQVLDPALRCRGSIRADEAEQRVWSAVERVLEQPDLIATEVARQHATADERRAEIAHEMALVDELLAKCKREDQRWAEAYAGGVINLEELRAYRSEIATRRERLRDQHTALILHQETIDTSLVEVGALTSYCDRVRQRLKRFDLAEKRLALEALNLRVWWTPGQPLKIEGSIPLDEIVSSTSRRRA